MDAVTLGLAQASAKRSFAARGRELRVVGTNTHIPTRNAPPNNISSGSTGITSQSVHTILTGTRTLRLAFSNYYNNNGVDADGPNNITVKAGIRLIDGSQMSVFFNGRRQAVIEPGQTIVSDPIGVSFVKGDTFICRTFVSVYSGEAYPLGLTSRADLGEGVVSGDSVDSGTITASGTKDYRPWAILGWPSASTLNSPTVLTVGDSRTAGYGEVVSTGDAYGWVRHAFEGNLSCLNVGVSGSTAAGSNSIQLLRRRFALADAAGLRHDIAIVSYGINDLTGGATSAQVIARLQSLYTFLANRGCTVYAATIPPVTTSSDSWATTTGQTLAPSNAQRVAVNAWIRSKPAPLTGVFEFADAVETARDSGLWKVTGANFGYTADGTHESITGYTAEANTISLSAFGGNTLGA